jgi:hypothetical protein
MVSDMVKIIDRDLGYKQIALNFKQLKGRGVKVGVMGGETNDGVAVVDYAMYNEFGTSRIPARPFMATTADNNRDKVQEFAGFLVGKMIDRRLDATSVLKNLGEFYQAKIQETIRNAKEWAVPNAASTIAMKGSSSPLIDQGRLVQSIRYEVK